MSKISVDSYGFDHWSLLDYIETCCVDGNGIGTIDRRKLRCNQNKHPLLANDATESSKWKKIYSTRLKGYRDHWTDNPKTTVEMAVKAGVALLDHDGWDCLEDLEESGFIDIISQADGLVKITKLGCDAMAAIREHEASGGSIFDFNFKSQL